jgi:VCBS repeat-containing protein
VTVTITGTDDAAVFATSYDAGTGNHTEATVTDTATSDTTPAATFSADGKLSFTDADIHDTHTVSIDNTGHRGALTATVDDSTGVVSWHYSIVDANIDGFKGDDTFDVVLNDYSVTDPSTIVSTTHETVTVHLNGAADAVVNPSVTDTGKPTDIVFAPDQSGNSLNPLGHFVAVDPDSTDTFTWSLAADNANNGISIDAAGNLNIAGSASTGTHELQVTVTDADAPNGTTTTIDFNLLIGDNQTDTMPSSPTFVLASTNNIEAGNGGADPLTGSSGVDYIIGGQGNDTIKGLGGADVLVGGGGSDSFVFAAASDSTHAAYDTILDFTSGGGNSGDKLDFSAIGTINGIQTVEPLSAGSTLDAGKVGWVVSGGNTIVYANTSSSAETIGTNTDMEIHLTHVTALNATTDFILH